MAKKLFAIILSLLIVAPIKAQRTKNVKIEYTYVGADNISIDEAKRIALDRAKAQAIADEFGTVVSQSNYTSVTNSNGDSSVDFQSIGRSDLRGEWIETTKEPVYEIGYSDGLLCVSVKARGVIREQQSSRASLNVKILRNIPDPRNESKDFKNSDDLYLYFSSPVNGYLSVYLTDKDNAYCLLPYARQKNGIFDIVANREYILFDRKSAELENRHLVDEYTMTCGKTEEQNILIVLFSENRFVKSSDTGISDKLPRQLTLKEFNKWVSENRNKDTSMQLIEKPFVIHP